MKTPAEVDEFLLAKGREIWGCHALDDDSMRRLAHEVFDEGFRDGYEHGLLTFGQHWSSYSRAETATHEPGTGEAPENETWAEMQCRETLAGATLRKY